MLAVAVWAAVVVAVAALVWQVIDTAGRDAFSGGNVDDVVQQATAEPSDQTPSSTPGASASPTPSPSPSGGGPLPTSAPRPQTRVWTGTGGSVVARCAGGAVSLRSAVPGDGYRYEVDDRGPDRLRVEFVGGDQEVRVEAVCSGGVPRFEVDGPGSDGSGSDGSGSDGSGNSGSGSSGSGDG